MSGGYVGRQQSVALYDAYTKKQSSNIFAPITRSRKNLIINGGMEVDQRGTSFASGNGIYTLDRWVAWNAALNKSTDVPSLQGLLNSAELTVTIPGAGSFVALEQKVENEKILAGRIFTLSFWVKGSVAGTAVARGYSQSNGVGFGNVEFPITASWQRIERTFTVPMLGGSTSDFCSFGLDFNVNGATNLGYGAGVSEPSYAGTVWVTGVQLEAGDTATDFEYRHIGEELALCQRYFYLWQGNYWGSPASRDDPFRNFMFDFPVAMRTSPAISGIVAGQPLLVGEVSTTFVRLYRNQGDATTSINATQFNADAEL